MKIKREVNKYVNKNVYFCGLSELSTQQDHNGIKTLYLFDEGDKYLWRTVTAVL